MDLQWEEGFKISLSLDRNAATVSANREGLLSLASHLLSLAEEAPGSHVHYDRHNSLESGSAELIVEKID